MKGVLPLMVGSLPSTSRIEYRLGDFSTTFRNDRLSRVSNPLYNLFRDSTFSSNGLLGDR
jgi:hypothetical protein